MQSVASFAELVRARQLDSHDTAVEWLLHHKCVSSRQLALETDYWFSESSFRMVLWRMSKSGEVLCTETVGYYTRGNLTPAKVKYSLEERLEIGMVSHYMSNSDAAALYQTSKNTIMRYKQLWRDSRSITNSLAKTSGHVISPRLARRIRKERRAGAKTLVLARRYNVTESTIRNIIHHRTHKND